MFDENTFSQSLVRWWSHHQCFTMFRIRSVVKDATTASSLAGAVIIRDQSKSEDVAGRRGRKLALGFEPIRLSLQVPWCAKSQIFGLNQVHLSGRIHIH